MHNEELLESFFDDLDLDDDSSEKKEKNIKKENNGKETGDVFDFSDNGTFEDEKEVEKKENIDSLFSDIDDLEEDTNKNDLSFDDEDEENNNSDNKNNEDDDKEESLDSFFSSETYNESDEEDEDEENERKTEIDDEEVEEVEEDNIKEDEVKENSLDSFFDDEEIIERENKISEDEDNERDDEDEDNEREDNERDDEDEDEDNEREDNNDVRLRNEVSSNDFDSRVTPVEEDSGFKDDGYTSLYEDQTEGYNAEDVNKNVKIGKNPIIFMSDGKKYSLYKLLFNSLSREYGDLFSNSKISSNEYKGLRLENFKETILKVGNYKHSTYLDLAGINTKDLSKEVNEKEIGETMAQLWGGELFEKKGLNMIKSNFFWKGKFYLLKNTFLDSEDFYNIATGLVKNADFETILVGYDILNNKYIFQKIETLLHYSVVGGSGAGKTVGIVQLITQYLMKNNSDVIFIEKGTDLDTFYRKSKRMLYKADVESLRYENIISIFTYLNMELGRRKAKFGEYGSGKIQEYNEHAKREGKPLLRYLLFVVDEFARLRETLKTESPKTEEFFIRQLQSLMAVARSYGIFAMLSTQSPTSEGGVPNNIQNNLATKILGKTQQASSVSYLQHTDERSIVRQSRISLGDFLYKSQGDKGFTVIRMFKVDQDLDRYIQEGYIVPKTDEEQRQIGDINEHSDVVINNEILKLVKASGNLELLDTSRFGEYGINIVGLESIFGVKRIAMIMIINLLFEWFEKEVVKKLRETSLTPTAFDMENAIQTSLDKRKNEQLGFIFILVQSLYDKYLNTKIKTEKISKSAIKSKGGDEETEGIEIYIESIKENIVYNANELIDVLLENIN